MISNALRDRSALVLTMAWLASPAAARALDSAQTSVAQAEAPVSATPNQASGEAGLGDIVVTAERRSTNVQNTPLAVTAIAGAALQQGGAVNAQSLVTLVPNVRITNYQPIANIFIRGTGGGVINQYGDPGVAYNLGGVYIQRPFGTAATFYDLDRVEVLKGPQGTLYGRNATSGAINVIPNVPAFETAGEIGLQVGNYADVESHGMFNQPLGDTVAVRAAFRTVRHDGYLSNGQNDANSYAGRLSLLYKPNADFSFLLVGDYFKDDSVGPGDVPIYSDNVNKWLDPNNPWAALLPLSQGGPASPAFIPGEVPGTHSQIGTNPFVRNTQFGVTGTIDWNLGFADLTAIGAYRRTKLDSASYFQGLEIFNNVVAKQYSGELRLTSTGSGPFRWIVGAFYFFEHQDVIQIPLNSNGYQPVRNPNLDDESYAFFGQATYSLTDRFRVTGGIRYTKEDKSKDGTVVIPYTGLNAATCVAPATYSTTQVSCTVPDVGRLSFNDVSWKGGVEFDAGPHSLLFASVSKGFKAGGFWAGLAPNSYPPEKLIAYEVGSKNRFLDNRLQINVDAFYWIYKNQQVISLGNIQPAGFATTVKSADSHIYGLEVQTVFQLSDNDQISAEVDYLHGEFTNYLQPIFQVPLGGRLVTLQPAADFSGARRPFTPDFAGYVRYQHRFDLAGGGQLTASANVHGESDDRLAVTNRIGEQRPAYAQGDLDLTFISPDKRWTVSAFVNNITNVAVLTSALRSSIVTTPANKEFSGILPPRTFGAAVNFKF